MKKKYKTGFYGGKFMPFHLGHKFCLDRCAEECETAYLIIFTNGKEELEILSENEDYNLSAEARFQKIIEIASTYDNVIPALIDVSDCKYEDGSEDWDAETPLVRMVCGDRIDAVYGSEIGYKPYFDRAYPEAEYVLVDPPRINYPISGTMCREMNEKERKVWIV